MSCGVSHRRGSDPAWLWLWCRMAAVASIQPLAREPPYAAGVALKSEKPQKTQKKKKKKEQAEREFICSWPHRMRSCEELRSVQQQNRRAPWNRTEPQ